MILVIGIGNSLRSDDGFGPAVVRAVEVLPEFQENDLINFVCAHQLVPEQAEMAAGADLIIFADAAVTGDPGSVTSAELIPGEKEVSLRVSHSLSPTDLLAITGSLYGQSPRAYIYTGVGASFEIGEVLSLPCRQAVSVAANLIAEKLRESVL